MDKNTLPESVKPHNWGLTDESAQPVLSLTREQLEYAYRIRKFQYVMQDAQDHAEDMLQDDDPETLDSLTEKDFEAMADLFEKHEDCNIDENSTWESVIENYLETRKRIG